MDEGYVRMQCESEMLVLQWIDSPQWLAIFLHRVGFVFREDSELAIRKKILDPSMVVETSAPTKAPLPKPTKCWNY